ncbi:hypothetical protein HYV50_01495 [Candidatus Pacearchaeota archaeon]|nr:hypothetical protein [Candidatus Pacearchaeota archaeon]
MVIGFKQKGKKYFRCKFCRILYKEKKLAEEHEASCKKYNSQISNLNKEIGI